MSTTGQQFYICSQCGKHRLTAGTRDELERKMREHRRTCPATPRKRATGTRANVYHGRADGTVYVVPYKGEAGPLPPRFDLRKHSPTGFAWGYCGSGPAQLALAILAHATGDDRLALDAYQRFKEDVIAGQVGDTFELTTDDVLDWTHEHAAKHAGEKGGPR